jgi:long-chain acyl-CoA synthetase
VVKSLIIDRISLFVAIPTVYKILAEKDMPFLVKLLLNLRLCVSGAAPLPVRVIHDFESAFKVPLSKGTASRRRLPLSPSTHSNPAGTSPAPWVCRCPVWK